MISGGDLCTNCNEKQMPPWRPDVSNNARACQSCGHVEERSAEKAGGIK